MKKIWKTPLIRSFGKINEEKCVVLGTLTTDRRRKIVQTFKITNLIEFQYTGEDNYSDLAISKIIELGYPKFVLCDLPLHVLKEIYNLIDIFESIEAYKEYYIAGFCDELSYFGVRYALIPNSKFS